MSNAIIVHKGRTVTVEVDLGVDVSTDTITSEIRSEPGLDAPLIATWSVANKTDGTDGLIVLTLDDAVTGGIVAKRGYMDLKRVVGTEPIAVFDRALEVEFRGSVTA